MAARCPHCGESLATYLTTVEHEASVLQVLACTHCETFLGLWDPDHGRGRPYDEGTIVDLLYGAVTAEDADVATTFMSVAIGQMDSQVRAVGGGIDPATFGRILAGVLSKLDGRRRQDRDPGEGWGGGRPR